MTSCIAGLLSLTLAAAPAPAPAAVASPAATESLTAEKKGPTPAALTQSVRARTPEEQAAASGLLLQAGLDHALGLGTFVDPQRYALVIAYLTLAPVYTFGLFGRRFAASASYRLGLEYTLPDVETGRRVTFGDLRLALSAPVLLKDTALTGIGFTPALSLTVPTSPEAWNARLITNLGLSVTASRSLGPVDLRLAVSGSHGFFASAQTGMLATQARDSSGDLYVVCRRDETVCGFSNWNTEWTFSVGGQVGWHVAERFLVFVGYTFIKAWHHPATLAVDDITPKALDANGNPVACVGFCQVDRTQAFVALSYEVTPHLSVDLGLSTAQTPLTDDDRQVRFPWLSIGAWASNRSTILLSIFAVY